MLDTLKAYRCLTCLWLPLVFPAIPTEALPQAGERWRVLGLWRTLSAPELSTDILLGICQGT